MGPPVLGAHVSIAGGLEEAFARAKSISCEAIQIFSKNQRQWAAKPLAAEQVEAWHQNRKNSKVRAILIHDSYLINLADPTKAGVKKAREAFVDEIRRAEALGVQGLVFHPGAHMGRGKRGGSSGSSLALITASPRASRPRQHCSLRTPRGRAAASDIASNNSGTSPKASPTPPDWASASTPATPLLAGMTSATGRATMPRCGSSTMWWACAAYRLST